MFDIPHGLLNELLAEELVLETKRLFYDSSFTGGILDYQHIQSKYSMFVSFFFNCNTSIMDRTLTALGLTLKHYVSDTALF